MLVALVATDRPGGLDLRLKTRPDHVAFLERLRVEGRLAFAGPFLNDEEKPNGSLVVIEAESVAEARAIMAADPYAKAGLFATAEFRPWAWVFSGPAGKR